jgi:hypothetical protein
MLILPTVNSAISVFLSIIGFAVGILALMATPFELVGLILSTVGFVGGGAYIVDVAVRRRVVRRPPSQEKDIRPEHFISIAEVRAGEYRFARPHDSTESQIYPYVDLCHYSPHLRAENNLTRLERLEIHGRWRRLCPRGLLHLEKLVDGEWRPIAISEIFPLSADGYQSFVHPNKKLQRQLIELGHGDIRRSVDRRKKVLLLNLWVVDRAFRSAGHGRSQVLGGQANLLVLRHIAEFWNSRNRFPPTLFLVESSNEYLVAALRRLTFTPMGTSKTAVPLYGTRSDTLRGALPNEYRSLRQAVRQLETTEIAQATTLPPTDWQRRFRA